MASGKVGRYALYGCFGCLGLVLTVVLIGGGAVGWIVASAEEEQLEQRNLVADVPLVELAPPEPVEGAAGESPAAADLPRAVGRVVLDLQNTDQVRVVAGAPGSAPEVRATYDGTMYTLSENLETAGETWSYEVRFERTGSAMLALFKEMGLVEGTDPDVEISLPPDMPVELEGRIRRGGAILQLGGAWLTAVDLDINQGGAQVAFGRPLRAPLERLTVSNRMGGLVLNDVGNASPRRIEASNAMGGLVLDLSGRWRRDGELSLDSSKSGKIDVTLPDDMQILGLDAYSSTVEPESGLPRLRVEVDGPMEGVEFRR